MGVLLGNGDGTFQAAVTYGTGGIYADSVAVADVNGDGKLDLVAENYGSNNVGVLLGNGDGTFQTAVTYGSGGAYPYSVAVADVNGDGKPDIVVANSGSSNVGVLLGNGDGTFQTAVAYGSGGSGASIGSGRGCERGRQARPRSGELLCWQRTVTTARLACCWATAMALSKQQ